eukprot:gb/GFBE01028834.1/.p1 GENE.gb/GFBE01028834.1/~~gb/GFBE01028834.1/.p1  ORF type:complete len:292 (+),score=59.85 gb/GFBE01028834.1/:1-876(+)
MSWYVGHDGRQVWVDSREQALTCDKPEAALPVVMLTYLASNTSKRVYAEHAVDDDDGKKGKKKEKQAGRQRGFIVCMDHHEDRVNVLPTIQAAVDKLLSSGVVSRVDLDESEGKKRSKKGREIVKEEVPDEAVGIPLGVNECRVEIVSRCQHQAHGVGFTISVSEGGASQRIHLFTAGKDLSVADWHSHLLEALRSGRGRVMLGRMSPAIAPDPPDVKEATSKKDAAKEEDDWLDSLMGRCMVDPKKEKPERRAGYAEAGASDDASRGGEKDAQAPKAPVQLPPWLQSRRR